MAFSKGKERSGRWPEEHSQHAEPESQQFYGYSTVFAKITLTGKGCKLPVGSGHGPVVETCAMVSLQGSLRAARFARSCTHADVHRCIPPASLLQSFSLSWTQEVQQPRVFTSSFFEFVDLSAKNESGF